METKIFKPPAMESFISSEHSGHAFFSSKTLIQRGLPVGKGRENLYRSLLYFDISSLPFSLTITKGTLNLFITADEFPAALKTLEAWQILSWWQQEKVCWGKQPLLSDAPAAATAITTPSKRGCVGLDVTSLVRDWYTGQSANFGLMLKMSDEFADNLVWFASGRFCDSQAWPYLEINFMSSCQHCAGEGHRVMDISFNVITADILRFTSPVNVLLFNYAYLIINNGPHAASVQLEVSPNGAVWQTQSNLAKVNPGQLVSLVPDTVAKFSRLGYRSCQPGKNTSLTVYIQGIS